jgi:putative DNA primase/helicase
MSHDRTRVVSLNTDSVTLQVARGDEQAVNEIIAAWEAQFGFQMERTQLLDHRALNINNYIELSQEDGKAAQIKSKGALAHAPGIAADHDRLIVAQAVGAWMREGTPIEKTIRSAIDAREILRFTEMRSAPSGALLLDAKPIGRICRVYRSTRNDLPILTRAATAKASAQTLEAGFAVLKGTHWPEADDLDEAWYVGQAKLLIAQTSIAYTPCMNAKAKELESLGLRVMARGGAATRAGSDGEPDTHHWVQAIGRNVSGDEALGVRLTTGQGSTIGKGFIAAKGPLHHPDSKVLTVTGPHGEHLEVHALSASQAKAIAQGNPESVGIELQSAGVVEVLNPSTGTHFALDGSITPRFEALIEAEVTPTQRTASHDDSSLNNDQFLQVMFGDDLPFAFVCSHQIPPDHPDESKRLGIWQGGSLQYAKGLYQLAERQNYTCVSAFTPDDDGIYRRQQSQFLGLYFVVLDDIGTKVAIDPRTLGLGEPTLINETSPGNHQWIYRLSTPLHDLGQASYLMREVLGMPVQGHFLTDQGAKGIGRLCKLPVGCNLKLALKSPWTNRTIAWNPELAYDAQTIAAWFGADLNHASPMRTPAQAADDASDHSLIVALQAEGLLKRQIASSTGWWEIRCIHMHLHTKGVDSGAGVKVNANGSWTFRCQHAHCEALKPRDLYRYLVERGHQLTPPQAALSVSRIDRSVLQFEDESFTWMAPDDGPWDEPYYYPDPELATQATPGRAAGGTTASPATAKPTIYVDPGLLPAIVKQSCALLDAVVYKRGVQLVRIGRGSELADGVMRLGSQPVLLPVTRQWIIRELTEKASFERWDKRTQNYKIIDCPTNIAATIESGTDDETFNPLVALASVPFLRADGSVGDTPGYDPATGLYYAPTLSFAPLSAHPDWHEARAALDQLLDLVKQFPFASDASRSVFLSDVLTAIARPTLPKSPVVLYSATMAGTGKTLIASLPNLIAYGYATTHPWPHGNDEELKKIFTSILLAGDPVVVFDNVPNGAMIKSAALSQFATSDDYADRKLGESVRVRCKNRTRVVLTGNNVTLASDNARRTLVCDLQLAVESPRDRGVIFEQPALASFVLANRSSLIHAALTVLRAYALHPEPLRLPPLESFEDWSWRVRDALIWLGQEDPVSAVRFDNEGTGEIAQAFEAIAAMASVKCRKTTGRALEFRANELVQWALSAGNLRDALEMAGCSDATSTAKLGYWLRAHRNRIAGGRKLCCREVKQGREPNQWSLANSQPTSDE